MSFIVNRREVVRPEGMKSQFGREPSVAWQLQGHGLSRTVLRPSDTSVSHAPGSGRSTRPVSQDAVPSRLPSIRRGRTTRSEYASADVILNLERAGMAIARSTLAHWVGECGAQLQPLVDALSAELLRHDVLHADETPVGMLKPGNGKTHKAYIWTYCTTTFNTTKAVVFNFAETRSGENVREFLGKDGENP